jgi:DNA-directed RNA polymerase subunit RPC12/RpoP
MFSFIYGGFNQFYSKNMKWFNLKYGKCPKCDSEYNFDIDDKARFYTCTCGFVISVKKYDEIVASMTNVSYSDTLQIGSNEFV